MKSSPLHFLREVFLSTGTTGALCPSSQHLARRMVEAAGVREARSIVELGAGEGAVTRLIVRERRSASEFVAVEKNPRLVELLEERFPDVSFVEGCASELSRHLGRCGLKSPQAVVSGLPWAIFPGETQDSILDEVVMAMAPDGVFATFAYFGPHWLPSGAAFRKRLCQRFRSVRTTRVEIRNIPPAFVYAASEPKKSGEPAL